MPEVSLTTSCRDRAVLGVPALVASIDRVPMVGSQQGQQIAKEEGGKEES